MATSNLSLKESVQQAVAAQVEPQQTQIQDEPQQTNEPQNQDDGVVEVDASPEEINEALTMFRTLNDPAKAKEFIKSLNLGETKVTPQQATETILDVLRAELGEENSDLAEKLAPALEKLIAREVKTPMQNLTVEQQIKEAKVEIDSLFTELGKELPDFNNLSDQMGEVMKTIAPQKGVSMRSYMVNVYKLAGGKMPAQQSSSNSSSTKTNVKTAVKSVVTKMQQNAKEAKTNVSSNVDADGTVRSAPQKMSARQAVLAAVEEIQGKK